eukprot:SAG22_NODE_4540_length_1240_cov_1.023663_2_plen_118_part_00
MHWRHTQLLDMSLEVLCNRGDDPSTEVKSRVFRAAGELLPHWAQTARRRGQDELSRDAVAATWALHCRLQQTVLRALRAQPEQGVSVVETALRWCASFVLLFSDGHLAAARQVFGRA